MQSRDWFAVHFKEIENSKFFSLVTREKVINQKHSQILYNRTRIIQIKMRLSHFNLYYPGPVIEYLGVQYIKLKFNKFYHKIYLILILFSACN